MPLIRCKHYDDNGTPIRRGCPKTGVCSFIHPSDPEWSSAPKSRASQNGPLQSMSSSAGVDSGSSGRKKRHEPDSGHAENGRGSRSSGFGEWKKSGSNVKWKNSEQGAPFLTGANASGSAGEGWGNRAGGSGGSGVDTSSGEDSRWGTSTGDTSTGDSGWGNMSRNDLPSTTWADNGKGKGKEKENDTRKGSTNGWGFTSGFGDSPKNASIQWGDPSGTTTGWEQGSGAERSGSSGWGNSTWGDSASSWGGGASSWGNAGSSGWGGSTNSGLGDASKKTSGAWGEMPITTTTASKPNSSPRPSYEAVSASSATKDALEASIQSDSTTAVSTSAKPIDSRRRSSTSSPTKTNNGQTSVTSWGNSNSVVRAASLAPAPPEPTNSVPAQANELSPPQAEPGREDGGLDYGSPEAGNVDAIPMEVDEVENEVEPLRETSPPSNEAQAPKSPTGSVSSASKKRARSHSFDARQAFTRSDYAKALIESAVCQYQYDQAQAAYVKQKALQRSKVYSNAGPRAIETLTQLGSKRAAELEQAQKGRSKAAKRLVAISEYYHDCSELPLDWRHAEDADPVEFVGKSIEDVKAWVNKAAELLKVSTAGDTDTRVGIGRIRDDSPAVVSAASAALAHELSTKLSKIGKRVEDQQSVLRMLQDDSERMLDKDMEKKWEFFSSIHGKIKQHLRTCRERKAETDAAITEVRQEMDSLLGMDRRCQEEHEDVREEHRVLSARVDELQQQYHTSIKEIQENRAEIQRILSQFRDAEEERKKVPDPVDPAILIEHLRPAVLQTVHNEIQNVQAIVTEGFTNSMATFQKQTADALWARVEPMVQLNAVILNNINSRGVSKSGSPLPQMSNPVPSTQ
ncbi:hypothetical protein BDY19DRAFT_917458 [Irpex rosettiformis]|uniref:Uncharacterized protein n=1 Tax=Irpex rosettiformis TaxID=378272 RepID=A0ACB8UGI5_9APHY|nr:hypothetical protein BDY19DRAFT_917458 [Irpex rosettiformis]